ncbi:MAG: 7-carboxy-7-deazaguanine synthase [Rhodothermia bacterium]|nr:7-carboxy-7-deazaguanine synthase [Rhodothermia bacterium]
MTYSVKEIYFTVQGEGAQTGRPAIFLRFAGCNLWSGREEDRATAVCQFCDTDFVGTDGPGGGKFESPDRLCDSVSQVWRDEMGQANGRSGPEPRPLVVATGGEPLLQLDEQLITALHDSGFEVAVETNGTVDIPRGIDWLCVSPKMGADLVVRSGDELKLVFPQDGVDPASFEELNFRYFSLQPMDGPLVEANTSAAVSYCRQNPRWRVSLQTHKILGIP